MLIVVSRNHDVPFILTWSPFLRKTGWDMCCVDSCDGG